MPTVPTEKGKEKEKEKLNEEGRRKNMFRLWLMEDGSVQAPQTLKGTK